MYLMSAGLVAHNNAYEVLVHGAALCVVSSAYAAVLAPPG